MKREGGGGARVMYCIIVPGLERPGEGEDLPPGPLAALSDNVENRPAQAQGYQPPGRRTPRRGTPRGFFLDRYVY